MYSCFPQRLLQIPFAEIHVSVTFFFFFFFYFSINHPYLQSLPTLYLQPCFYPLSYIIPEKDLF